MKCAAELEPFSISSQTGIGRHLYFATKYDAAVKQFKRVLELDPNSFLALAHLGQTYVKKSMFREAIDCFNKANAITNRMEPAILSGLGYTYGILGKQEEALKILEELINLSGQRYIRPFYIAGIYIGLGDKDKAFQWLEAANEARDPAVIWLNVDPAFDRLRDDPRFRDLSSRMNLGGQGEK